MLNKAVTSGISSAFSAMADAVKRVEVICVSRGQYNPSTDSFNEIEKRFITTAIQAKKGHISEGEGSREFVKLIVKHVRGMRLTTGAKIVMNGTEYSVHESTVTAIGSAIHTWSVEARI